MDVRILLSHQIKTLALTYYLRLPWSLSAAYDRMDHFFFLEIQIFFDFCGTTCLNFFYFQSLLLSTCSVGSSSSTFPLSVHVIYVYVLIFILISKANLIIIQFLEWEFNKVCHFGKSCTLFVQFLTSNYISSSLFLNIITEI